MNNETKETPGYYAILIPQVRYDKNLKPMEKILYAELTALSNKNGYSHASNSYFAELYDCDKATISRYISNLEKYGYIKTEIIRDEKNAITERKIYICTDKIVNANDEKIITPNNKKVKTPNDKKVKENNTSKNNINNNNIIISHNEKTEVKKSTGKNSKAELFDYISEYTQNETLRKLLTSFLINLLKNTRGYTLEQWKIQLDNLSKYSCGNEQLAVEKVSNAFSAGYRQIVYPNELNNITQGSNQPGNFESRRF